MYARRNFLIIETSSVTLWEARPAVNLSPFLFPPLRFHFHFVSSYTKKCPQQGAEEKGGGMAALKNTATKAFETPPPQPTPEWVLVMMEQKNLQFYLLMEQILGQCVGIFFYREHTALTKK